jgi:hypothetical protein
LALGEGAKGAAIGGAFAFGIAGTIGATAVVSPFAAAVLGVGAVSYGLYGSATSAYENFSQGRIASGVVDVLTGLLDFRDLTRSVSHGVSTFKSSADSGNWYNGSNHWGVSAWDVVKGYEGQSSGVTRDTMVWARQNTLGYYNGEMMPHGVRTGAPGSAHRDQFPSGSVLNNANDLGTISDALEQLPHQTRHNVEAAIKLRGEFNTSTSYGSSTLGMTADGIRVQSGWGQRYDSLMQGTYKALELAREIGYSFPGHRYDPKNQPGLYYASHVEPQMAGLNKNQTIFAQSNESGMCKNCPDFFQKLASATQLERIVVDPTGIYIFKIDGTIDYIRHQ